MNLVFLVQNFTFYCITFGLIVKKTNLHGRKSRFVLKIDKKRPNFCLANYFKVIWTEKSVFWPLCQFFYFSEGKNRLRGERKMVYGGGNFENILPNRIFTSMGSRKSKNVPKWPKLDKFEIFLKKIDPYLSEMWFQICQTR